MYKDLTGLSFDDHRLTKILGLFNLFTEKEAPAAGWPLSLFLFWGGWGLSALVIQICTIHLCVWGGGGGGGGRACACRQLCE